MIDYALKIYVTGIIGFLLSLFLSGLAESSKSFLKAVFGERSERVVKITVSVIVALSMLCMVVGGLTYIWTFL